MAIKKILKSQQQLEKIQQVVKQKVEDKKLLQQVHAEGEQLNIVERRGFLKSAVAMLGGVGVATVAPTALANSNLPPNVPSWTKSLGKGVLENPYGKPSPYESGVVRRTVEWLTPDSISSVSMTPLQDLKGIITPNSLVFERFHAGLPEINPAEHRLMIHGLVERPIVFTMDDLKRFPSVSEIKFLECPANGGMEWKGPQMKGVQFTHGCCLVVSGVAFDFLLCWQKWVLNQKVNGFWQKVPMVRA